MTLDLRDHKADAFLLMSCSFGIATANSVIFAALGDIQDKFGFATASLGFISGAGFLSGFLAQLFIAPYADRGHAKRLIMLGLLVSALGAILMSTSTSLTQFIVARAVIGSSFGLVMPAVRALISHVDPERLGKLAGIELLGFVAGPLFGGMLIDPIGLSSTFLVFGGVSLVTLFAIAFRSFPELPTNETSQRASIELLRYPRVRIAVLLAMAIQAPVGIFDSLWDRYLTDLGGGNMMVGISFGLYTIPFIAFASYGGRLADKHDPQKVAMYAMIFVVPAVGGYGLFRTLPPVVALNVLEGIAQALMYPASAAAVALAAPIGRASAAQGLAGASGLLMSMLLAFITPAIYGHFGGASQNGGIVAFGAVALLMASLTLLAVVMLWRLGRREKLLSKTADISSSVR
jgi:MFS family permease